MRKTIIQLLGGIIGIALIFLVIQFALAVRPVKGEPAAAATSPDPVDALELRFEELGIPLKEIRLVERSPLNVEITFQSASEDDKTTFEDLWWSFLAQREADLAYLYTGEHIRSYTLVVMNTKGDPIGGITSFLYPNDPDQQLTSAGPAAIGDDETYDLILKEWNIGKNEWLSLQVESDHYARENTKYVYMEWTTGTDLFEDSKARVQAVGGAPHQLEAFNSRHGAQIAIVRAKIFDPQGNLLAHFIYDAERQRQSVRLVEGIEAEWMPGVASEALFTETPVPTPTSWPMQPTLTPAPYP